MPQGHLRQGAGVRRSRGAATRSTENRRISRDFMPFLLRRTNASYNSSVVLLDPVCLLPCFLGPLYMRSHRLTRVATNLALGLAAVVLAVGPAAYAACWCGFQPAPTSTGCHARIGCCCGQRCSSAAKSCCGSTQSQQTRSADCGCAAPRINGLASSDQRTGGPRVDYTFLPVFGLLAVCIGMGGFTTIARPQSSALGGPPGRRLHALLSVWRN